MLGSSVPSDPESNSTPAPVPPAAAKPKISLSIQNKEMQNDLAVWYRQLNAVSSDEKLAAEMAEFGYDAEEKAQAVQLLQAAAQSVGLRYELLGERGGNQGEFSVSLEAARKEYKKFRGISRAVFRQRPDRLGLNVSGEAPRDIDLFIIHARSSYSAAVTEPWAKKMSRRGYPAAKLKAMTERLDALVEKGSAAAESRGDAIAATAERNTAYEALREFMLEFRGVARAALEDVPGALNQLGL